MSREFKKTNKEVVQILKEILAAMEVKDFNKFRIRAYQNAISAIDSLTTSVYDMWEGHRLEEIPGVGAGLSSHLNELFSTGDVKEFHVFKQGLPEGMFSLIGTRGIGAKKALKLALAFNLKSREDALQKVKEAAEQGKIQVLDGFGEKSEKDILAALNDVKKTKNEKTRMLLYQAEQISQRAMDYLKQLDVISKIDALGSLRRRNATVGDIDLVVATTDSDAVIEHFSKYPEIEDILVRGEKKIAVVLKNDVQVDLRTSTPQAYGAMLQYSTGSKQHNVVLRTFALEKKMSLSEYGIKYKDQLEEYPDEESFYARLGLQYIPPEIRQGKNEVELADQNKLPTLVELTDIKGDFHTHTNDSDGENTFLEMVNAAIDLGYKYYGVTDHAPSVQSRGYDEVERIIHSRLEMIKKFNESQDKLHVFYGYEVNILADSTMALPDALLKKLDYSIASIHTSFDQPREKLTERLLMALNHPYVTIIGHPSGRLINEREACDIDWTKVLLAARDNNKIIEINAQPNRLDLADDLVKEAIEYGVRLVINTDAHAIDQLHNMRYGIDVARRGFGTKANFINTLDLTEVKKALNIK